MSSSSICRLVMHNFRLDILSCVEREPMTPTQVSARIGRPTTAVSYHLKLLESQELVDRIGAEESEDVLYVATLDSHPEWVAKAVRGHRQAGTK
jgi:DNA-binding transcriptional ArsR family regulator